MNNSDNSTQFLKEVYGGHGSSALSNEEYEIPPNLNTFFDSLERKGID
jgi:hypothetical protein